MDGYSGTFYLHDGNQSVAEVALDQNFQPTLYAYNGFGASGLEWRSGSGTSYSAYTYDPQGSVVQPVTLYQTGGATPVIRVRASSAYDGFGLGYTATADGSLSGDVYDAVAFGGQAGYYRDEWTGLYFLTHRYYEAGSGRFVNRDPIGYGGGINLYGFCGNNPVNGSDPSGLDWLDTASNFSAGAGDIISGGLTRQFRQHFGYDDVVDKQSGAYRGGQVVGVAYLAVDTVVGGVGVVNGVRAIRAAGGVRAVVATATIARAKKLGLAYQIRSGGAVHVLENARTLTVTETHPGILNVLRRYNGGQVNLVRKEFWQHVLPHQHTYSLGNPPATLNANWRTTFQNAGAAKATRIWRP